MTPEAIILSALCWTPLAVLIGGALWIVLTLGDLVDEPSLSERRMKRK